MRVFDVHEYGATGDGATLDTNAIQRAIDAAADSRQSGTAAQVLMRGGKKYLIGTLRLKGAIEFHLADDAELLVSTRRKDYLAHEDVQAEGAGGGEAAIIAQNVEGLKISGTGSINGRALEFMDHYEEPNEWWIPKGFRPRLMVLTSCRDLEIRNMSLTQAPFWSLHLVGCERVLVDGLRVRNQMDVPNCDGIAPDHCRDVEIRNCDITCGDDAIVIKATRTAADHGPSARILVRDCLLHTHDCGLKIGTETTQDIHDIRFERCKVVSSCRGIGILLRDEGSVYSVVAREIDMVSRFHADPWWGRGEAISLTAIPRTPGGKIGTIHDIRLEKITSRAENSARINGSAASRIRNVSLEDFSLTLERWTPYAGGLFDNRPTHSQADIEPHATVGYSVRDADNVTLKNCSLAWGKNLPPYFSHALEAERVTNLTYPEFRAVPAHPGVATIKII